MQESLSTRFSVSYHMKDLLKRDPQTVAEICKWLEINAEKPRDRSRKVSSRRMMARLIAARQLLKAAEGDTITSESVMNRTEGKVADRLIADHTKTVNIKIELAGEPQQVVVDGQVVSRQLMSPELTPVDSDTSK